MLNLFKLLFLLINIDSETILTWFGMQDFANQRIEEGLSKLDISGQVSFETFRLIVQGFLQKVNDGLSLGDIEGILFFMIFIRFLILAIKYNLKTSFFITCIGALAGYLWYRHLIDLITGYRTILINLPYFRKLGVDGAQIKRMARASVMLKERFKDDVHWYNPIKLIYLAIKRGIIHTDPNTGFTYYIDPISMIISKLDEPIQAKILPTYYTIYGKFIPSMIKTCASFWQQLSGLASYAIITRIGKRYCPYLIRWHWTFLLIIGLLEGWVIGFIQRIIYYETFQLVPNLKDIPSYIISDLDAERYGYHGGLMDSAFNNPGIVKEIQFYNRILIAIVTTHMSFIFFGLFHAIWGQYFYVPFFVENVELHIGPRPTYSIYSGGNTAWQDPKEKEKNLNRFIPKLWYGWFGRGTSDKWQTAIAQALKKFFKKLIKKIKKTFDK